MNLDLSGFPPLPATDRRVEMHEPDDLCHGHCHIHHVDEPGEGYIGCFECGHLYRTARELRRAYRRVVLDMARTEPWFRSKPGWEQGKFRTWWQAWTVRAKHINFCQHCIHDF